MRGLIRPFQVYCDLSNTIANSILSATELLSCKAQEQADHYSVVGSACRNVNSRADLANFVRTLSVDRGAGQHARHQYKMPKDLHETDPLQPPVSIVSQPIGEGMNVSHCLPEVKVFHTDCPDRLGYRKRNRVRSATPEIAVQSAVVSLIKFCALGNAVNIQ